MMGQDTRRRLMRSPLAHSNELLQPRAKGRLPNLADTNPVSSDIPDLSCDDDSIDVLGCTEPGIVDAELIERDDTSVGPLDQARLQIALLEAEREELRGLIREAVEMEYKSLTHPTLMQLPAKSVWRRMAEFAAGGKAFTGERK